MSESSRKIVLDVDEKCYSFVEEYSDCIDDSERNVLNRLLNYSLREYESKYVDLKKVTKKWAILI